jgi:phage terminase large subunit-like protein
MSQKANKVQNETADRVWFTERQDCAVHLKQLRAGR